MSISTFKETVNSHANRNLCMTMVNVLKRGSTTAMENSRWSFFSRHACDNSHACDVEKPANCANDTYPGVSTGELVLENPYVSLPQNTFQPSENLSLSACKYIHSSPKKVGGQAKNTAPHDYQDIGDLDSSDDHITFKASETKDVVLIDHGTRELSESSIESQYATTEQSTLSSSQITSSNIIPGTSRHESFGFSPIPCQVVARRNPYRLSKNIFQDINTYPCSGSEIPNEHKLSFDAVVDCLYQNLEEHRQPMSARQPIEINLWMTGTSTADVKPSIIVTCDKDTLSHVESVLSLPHIQNQHNLVVLKKLSWRGSWKWQHPSKDLHGIRPRYYLCFRARDEKRIQYGGHISSLDVQFEDTACDFWCGSKIIKPQRPERATLSCILKVGPDVFGLTTAHSFHPASISREEYEGLSSVPSSNAFSRRVLIPDTDLINTKLSDLDWALITMNNTVTSSFPKGRLGSVVYNQPGEERDVHILSSVGVEAKGVLLCGTTATRTRSDAKRINFWNIELMDDQGTKPLTMN